MTISHLFYLLIYIKDYVLFLYDQFHTEAALGLFLYHLAALPGEFAAMCIVQRRGSHFFHHEVEGRDERLLAVRDSHGDGTVGCHRAVEHLADQLLGLLFLLRDAVRCAV